MQKILSEFAPFLPIVDDRHIIPKEKGVYMFLLKEGARLPKNAKGIRYESLFGMRVLYVGISSNIYKRLIRQHLRDGGISTLRKTLGVLWGYQLILRSARSKKTRFSVEDEAELTEWMRKNTVFYFLKSVRHVELEQDVIRHLRPVLNLKGNNDEINAKFRGTIKLQRKFTA